MESKKLRSLVGKGSVLIASPIKDLQKNINETCKGLVKTGVPLLYVSLNKPHEVVKLALKAGGIDTSRIYFIDCLGENSNQGLNKEHVTYIENPSNLTLLEMVINEFFEKIEGEKIILIDALATLLIYNNEESVIKFTKSVLAKTKQSRAVVFTPNSKGTAFAKKLAIHFDEYVKLG